MPFLGASQNADTTLIPEAPRTRIISNVVFQFDNRNERYDGLKARMNGLKLGIEFYKRIRMGFGFYANNGFYRLSNPLLEDSVTQSGHFTYSTFFTEVVFYRSFRWELSAIGALGGGNLEVRDLTLGPTLISAPKQMLHENVKVRDVALNAQFKIIPWLGVGAGVGYRNVLNIKDDYLKDTYSAPYLDFKLKIFLGYAVKSIFKPSAIEEEKAYYEWRKQKRHKAFKALFNK